MEQPMKQNNGSSRCETSAPLDDKDGKRRATEGPPGANRIRSLPIRGMSCLACARKIEAGLLRCHGVAKAEVDFVRRKVTVRFDPSKLGTDDLKATVEAIGYQVLEEQGDDLREELQETTTPSIRRLLSTPRPYLIGLLAALSVVGFYLGLLTLTSDWYNAKAEFKAYGFWIIALATGLGVQAALFSLLRAWHRGGAMKAAKCSLAASGGISTTAMAACCSHYLVAFLPALGLPFLSTAAASLASYQTYFFLAGVFSNVFGIALMLKMMGKSGMFELGALKSHLSFGLFPLKR